MKFFACWSAALLLLAVVHASGAFVVAPTNTRPYSTALFTATTTSSTTETCRQDVASDEFVSGSNDNEAAAQPQEEEEEEGQMLMDFVAMVKETPPGELGDEDVLLIRNVMAEFATMETKESAQIVENLLFRMVDEWQAAATEQTRAEIVLQPCTLDFNTAMDAWERSNSPRMAANRVGFIIFEQEELYNNGVMSAKPDMHGIQTALRLLAQSRDKGADKRAWSIFKNMKLYGLEPNGETYSAVVTAIARSKQRGAAQRAESLLRDAVEQYPPTVDSDGNTKGIIIDAFNAVLTGWAKSDTEEGPQRAAQLLDFMNALNEKHGGGTNVVKPNISSFTSLIDAYVQKGEWDSIHRGEQILNHLLEKFLNGDEKDEPNIATWTIVIGAWAKLSKRRVKAAADRADRLLKRMESLYQDGRTSVEPDAVAYFTVMNAWAASSADGAVQKAEDILNEMYEKWMDGHREGMMKPTIRSTRVVVDGWVKSNADDCMERAESLLRRIEELNSDDFENEADQLADIYRSLLFGWSKRNEPLKAQEYLNVMVSRGLKPDSFCYDKIIEAFTKKNEEYSLKETYQVFELMEQRRIAGDVKPNERVYTSFIRALTKAKAKGLANKAALVLKRMEEMYKDGNKGIKPTVYTYNAVLQACAESYSQDAAQRLEAFKIAIAHFNRLRECKQEPDHVTFGNMLQCVNLLPPSKQKDAVVTTTFQLCCDKGFVNSYVVRDLQHSASESLWRSLLSCPEGDADLARLPAKWSRRFNRKK